MEAESDTLRLQSDVRSRDPLISHGNAARAGAPQQEDAPESKDSLQKYWRLRLRLFDQLHNCKHTAPDVRKDERLCSCKTKSCNVPDAEIPKPVPGSGYSWTQALVLRNCPDRTRWRCGMVHAVASVLGAGHRASDCRNHSMAGWLLFKCEIEIIPIITATS